MNAERASNRAPLGLFLLLNSRPQSYRTGLSNHAPLGNAVKDFEVAEIVRFRGVTQDSTNN